MAVHLKTTTPNKLLSGYKKAIDDGHVETWSYDDDGDFTHTPAQWIRKAWLRPKVIAGEELIFYILAPTESRINSIEYAVYHGRFIESMLHHCDSLFTQAYASAMPEDGDIVS